MDKEKVGKFIADLRKSNKMTQEELAQKLLVDRTMVSKWERGIYLPNHDIILNLSNIFDISVNELYLGEKLNKENKQKVNEVTINILKDSKKKVKRVLCISCMIIAFLSLLFLSYYFVNNYKTFKMYVINGENNVIHNGIMFVSKKKMYIKLGTISNIESDNVKKFTLYYEKDGNKNILFIGDTSNDLYINEFGNNEDFSYSDLKYIINNSYLKIEYSNQRDSDIIKLTFSEDFINDKLFQNKDKEYIKKKLIDLE